ncbi:hypothetical protein JNM05_07515 [bacterium]|nr:hypothetical protein [bacterium]
MKKIMISMVVLLSGFNPATAQESSSIENKVDSVLIYQKQLMDYQQRMYAEVKYEDPLENKKAGIEFNPVATLLATAEKKSFALSGTYSRFDLDRKAEVAFPFFYMRSDENRLFTLDAHYRKFLGKHQNGFYLSGAMRFAHVEGMKWDYDYDNYYGYDRKVKTNKIGMMFGIGYRYFSKSGFYWGTSLSVGRYFTGNNHIASGFLDGTKYIFDIEILKFGVSF